MQERQLQHAAGAQTHSSPLFLFMRRPGCISGRESLAGRPSGSLRPPRGPLPLHFPRPPDRLSRCSEGGGLRCMWRGSIAVGRNNSYPRLSPPISTMGRLLRVLAACGAKDMDCDVHSHSCAVSERCLEPEGAPLRFVPLLCRHHA